MGRDEVHQPERQRFDARVRGQPLHLLQGAVGLDQRVHGYRRGAEGIEGLGGALDVGHAAWLGQHQVGGPARRLQHDLQQIGKARVLNRQHAHADAAEAVGRAGQQRRDQVRMLDLAPDRGTVLGVERDVEDGPELGLQLQALPHPRLDAAVMVTDGQRDGGRLARLEQGSARVRSSHDGSGCKGSSVRASGTQWVFPIAAAD